MMSNMPSKVVHHDARNSTVYHEDGGRTEIHTDREGNHRAQHYDREGNQGDAIDGAPGNTHNEYVEEHVQR